MKSISTVEVEETPTWIPKEYVSRKEYLRLYQKYRYHMDEEYRKKQMYKVKERYRLKNCPEKIFKDTSIQGV